MKLRTENIQKAYKGRKVVKGVTIEVNQGEIVGLLGPNGAGKTTSFYMIVGLVSPDQGEVFLDDQKITRSAMYKRAQMGIGYLPQEVSVFRKMSVENNIKTILEMTDLSKTEQAEKLESLLDEFGLKHVRHNRGESLSGGEKRRTEIARALATDPKFILLDEPFAGVDPIAVEDIQHIVAHLKDRNIGVLITDHNVQETLAITDRTYLLFEGAILRSGTAEELAADEQVRKVYLGQNFVLRKTHLDKRETNEERENRIMSSEEKSLEYISNLLNQAKIIRSGLAGRKVDPKAIVDLAERVEEFKQYFLTHDLGKRASEIFEEIKFGPVSDYRVGLRLANISWIAYIMIPLIGWLFFVLYLSWMKRWKEDTDQLIGQLDSFKQLIENPELEQML